MSLNGAEGLLHFTFDEHWKILKWDEHPAHRKSMNALAHSKALDYIGIYRDKQIFFHRDERLSPP